MSIPQFGREAALSPIDFSTGEKQVGAPLRAPDRAFFSAKAAGATGAPPLSKTGVHRSPGRGKRLIACVGLLHWFNAAIHTADFELVIGLLRSVHPALSEVVKLPYGTRDCAELYEGVHGFRLAALPHNSKLQYIRFEMPGELCEALGADGMLRLFAGLLQLESEGIRVKCTRVDLALDTQKFSASWVLRAFNAGVVSGRWSPDTLKYHGSSDGMTVTMGARSSDRFLRVYDKAEGECASFAREACTRVEQELKHGFADEVWRRLAVLPAGAWSEYFTALLNSFVQIDRRWWVSFLLTAHRAVIVLHRSRSTLQKTLAWIECQVAGSLSMGYDARGMSWLMAVIQQGREGRSARDALRVRLDQPDGLLAVAWPAGGAL